MMRPAAFQGSYGRHNRTGLLLAWLVTPFPQSPHITYSRGWHSPQVVIGRLLHQLQFTNTRDVDSNFDVLADIPTPSPPASNMYLTGELQQLKVMS